MSNNIDTKICPVCSAPLTKDIVESHAAYTFYIECRRCGSFSFAEELYYDNELHNLDERQRAAVSYVICRSQNLKHRRTFTTDDIREIARECYLPSPMEQVDNLIRWIGDSHPNPGETIRINVLDHRAIVGSITSGWNPTFGARV
ncbi:MAG: hypothetical protein HWD60_12515 [Defluviicoccus sp.]|nr:MAG: hypothetical protein HWD60_12515 [Defluviicoccus sp.]